MRRLLLVLALSAATPTVAAERSVYVGSFDKLRLQGPFEVRVQTGEAPAATLTGDQAAIDAVEVQPEGSTLILRAAIRAWQGRPSGAPAAKPVVITLATPVLSSASVLGAGTLTVAAMKAPRIDLSVTGAGMIKVAAATADALNAQVIGGGSIAVAGRSGTARLMTNGPGTIDAGGLDAGDLVVRLDGPGATQARARYTASVVNTGIGQVAVAGSPKCTVKSPAGGPVACGGQ